MSYSGKFKDKNNNLHPVTSVLYGTCDTAAATAAKVVTCTDFDAFMEGVTIRVKFTNANTAANPTVNINSTGAKSVYRFGTTTPVDGNSWAAGEVVELLYDGTSFFMVGADDLSVKQNATDNSLETEAKTIVGAINEHEGDISSLKSGLTNVQSDVKLNTQDLTTPSRTKNILPLSIDFIKANNTEGTWNGNVYTVNGITITFNTDSNGNITSITKSADTPSATTVLLLYKSLSTFLPSATTKVNGCPTGGGYQTYKIDIIDSNASIYAVDYGASADGVTISDTSLVYDLMVRIVIYTGSTTEITFYPMVRLAGVTDPTFAPYIPSVDARLEAVESATDIVDITSTFYTSLESGVTLNSNTHVYKQGRRISGCVSITLDSNLPSTTKDILTLKYAPISSIITFGSGSDADEYTANAIMYIYLYASGKKLKAANNTNVANVRYLTVNLDYYAEA